MAVFEPHCKVVLKRFWGRWIWGVYCKVGVFSQCSLSESGILNAGKLESFEFSLKKRQELFAEWKNIILQQNPEDFQSEWFIVVYRYLQTRDISEARELLI